MKGSRYAMLKLIESSNFLDNINNLIKPTQASVNAFNNWMPKSIQLDKEAELKDFLKYNFSQELGEKIHKWWLEVMHPMSRTPNWDFVSTCSLNDQKGLLLIEAKAHAVELHSEGKSIDTDASSDSKKNHVRIQKAIEEANVDICKNGHSVSISRNTCYQLSNRVAHAWWLANQGIPVILLYLGFLNCSDMDDGKNVLFKTDEDWQQCFHNHAQQVGVDKIINKWVDCGKSKFITICKSI